VTELAPGAASADLAFVNGAVYTVEEERPWAHALAVAGGRIVAVGEDDDVQPTVGPRTELVDLRGRLVLPGFQDSHVHPPQGGVERLHCDLTGGRTRDDFRMLIAAYAGAHPELEWILGGGWSMDAFPGGVPTAADADDVSGGRPVFLPNRDHHSAWVNSRALELAGIGKDTPDPPDGRIERDRSGNPTGALHEGAMSLVGRLVPPTSADELRAGLLEAQRYLHSLGITAWQDALVGGADCFDGFADSFETYLGLVEEGLLTARVVGALWWDRHRDLDQLEALVERRERAKVTGDGTRFRANSVKIMQDGVCETFTAALLQPYLDGHGHETGNCGLSFVDPESLKRYVSAIDGAGFQVHVHAIGDRAVREALDALEAAAGPARRDLRHHLAHLQVVHPDDLPRFRRLGVTANFQPLWAYADGQMVDLTIPFLGEERSAWQYPIGAIARQRSPLAFGSDWPVSSPDPLAEMHVAVTRTRVPEPGTIGEEEEGAFLPEQRVDLSTAVHAFTLGSAYVNHLDDVTGSISAGKHADLVVLDRDIFKLDRRDGGISSARVLLTMVGGEKVFEGPGL
jgi:predicted amidohydrolase YtcJ